MSYKINFCKPFTETSISMSILNGSPMFERQVVKNYQTYCLS